MPNEENGARQACAAVHGYGGNCFGTAFLNGPSLIGRKILLPWDLLARPGFIFPKPPRPPKSRRTTGCWAIWSSNSSRRGSLPIRKFTRAVSRGGLLVITQAFADRKDTHAQAAAGHRQKLSPGQNHRRFHAACQPQKDREFEVSLPAACRGSAEIPRQIPTRIHIAVHMKTAGLVVLADRWNPGWHARYNGKPVPILEADYAIRGVQVPAGKGTLEFYYRPASLVLSVRLASLAAVLLLGWLIVIWIRRRSGQRPPEANLQIDPPPTQG